MSKEMKVVVHDVETDGLPDMDRLTGQVAFVWDGSIVSGWPISKEFYSPEWDPEEIYWEPDEDRFGGPVIGVKYWVEFPIRLWNFNKWMVT